MQIYLLKFSINLASIFFYWFLSLASQFSGRCESFLNLLVLAYPFIDSFNVKCNVMYS